MNEKYFLNNIQQRILAASREKQHLNVFPNQFRLIGALILLLVLGEHIIVRGAANIVWMCNISALLTGVSLLLTLPYSAYVGSLWMVIGLASWSLNVLVNHTANDSLSYITHFIFASAGIYVLSRLPAPSRFWIGAFLWYLFSQLLSRLFTDPRENINLAFGIWPGWDNFFSNYFAFWFFTTSGCLLGLLFLNRVLRTHRRSRKPN